MIPTPVAIAQDQTRQSPSGEDASGDVVVVGSRRSFRLSERGLRAAQSAFRNYHQRYAPTSSLSFVVERRDGGSLPAGRVRLYFTDGTNRIRVPVDGSNRFDLATLPEGNWWLESNVSRRWVRIDPLTLSSQSNRYEYRLGDGRLQCRVSWAMLKASAPVLAAPLVGAAEAVGPCTSRKVGLYVRTPGIIRTASLTENSRTAPVTVGKDRRSYRLPAGDQAFSDEARVTITVYRDDAPGGQIKPPPTSPAMTTNAGRSD